MTEQHPITPPPELVRQWRCGPGTYMSDLVSAAQWGADQELEACCEWLEDWVGNDSYAIPMRAARRPKPPSLKQEALDELAGALAGGNISPDRAAKIRLALEQLDD